MITKDSELLSSNRRVRPDNHSGSGGEGIFREYNASNSLSIVTDLYFLFTRLAATVIPATRKISDSDGLGLPDIIV
jgi:hypothetical protein